MPPETPPELQLGAAEPASAPLVAAQKKKKKKR
jgi:hypothetical protein